MSLQVIYNCGIVIFEKQNEKTFLLHVLEIKNYNVDGFLYLDMEKYDLIVLDPPWQNKSVKRKKMY